MYTTDQETYEKIFESCLSELIASDHYLFKFSKIMFTGIVQGIRKISLVSDIEGGRKLRIQLDDSSENLEHGSSVAVNGVCLTAVKISQGWADFDIIQETLNRSNLSAL